MTLKYQTFKVYYIIDGVVVQDNNDTYTYPMPMYAQGKMMFCR
jgi:hypothetical protein